MFDMAPSSTAHHVDLATAMRRDAAFRPRSPVMVGHGRAAEVAGESAETAYQRGLTEGQALAEIGFDVERQALLRLLASAEALQSEPCPQLGQLIASAVEQLVRQIVGDFPVDPAWLQRRVAEASAVLADADRDRILHLNPADIASLADVDLGMKLRSDPQIPRGGLRIAAGEGWVEHGRPVYLDALRQALNPAGGAA